MPNGSRNWCFTLNNPTDEETTALPTELGQLGVQDTLFSSATHLVYQLERGSNGTPHYQGYVRFASQKSLTFVRKIFERAHWESARGSPKQNLEYCTKLESRVPGTEPVILGDFGGRANSDGSTYLKRDAFIDAVAASPSITKPQLIEKGGLAVLATQPNLLGTVRGLLTASLRRAGVTCVLYYGSPGCGKSRLADELYPDAYRKSPGIWWDSYCGESTVILDDFDADFMPLGDFLRAIDRYPLNVPVKGSFIALAATHFVITSNLLPREWYPDIPPTRLRAINRRITSVFEFREDGVVLQHEGKTFLIDHDGSRGKPYDLPWLIDDCPPESIGQVIDLPGDPYPLPYYSPLAWSQSPPYCPQ